MIYKRKSRKNNKKRSNIRSVDCIWKNRRVNLHTRLKSDLCRLKSNKSKKWNRKTKRSLTDRHTWKIKRKNSTKWKRNEISTVRFKNSQMTVARLIQWESGEASMRWTCRSQIMRRWRRLMKVILLRKIRRKYQDTDWSQLQHRSNTQLICMKILLNLRLRLVANVSIQWWLEIQRIHHEPRSRMQRCSTYTTATWRSSTEA